MTQLSTRLGLLRAAFPGRRVLFAAGVVALAAAALLNRDWLLAAGASSLLLSVVPCLAMCALGMCMKSGGTSCSAPPAARDASGTAPIGESSDPARAPAAASPPDAR